MTRDFAVEGGSLFWTRPCIGRDGRRKLWRFGFPELKRVLVREDLPADEGAIVIDGKRVHFIANQCWTAASINEPFRPLAGSVPGSSYHRSFAYSAHFGLLLLSLTESEPGAFIVRTTLAQ